LDISVISEQSDIFRFYDIIGHPFTDFMKRWSAEVTFEESRAHLGVERSNDLISLSTGRLPACLDFAVSPLFLVSTSIPTEISLFNGPLGIESNKRPLLMYSSPFAVIFGAISFIRQPPEP